MKKLKLFILLFAFTLGVMAQQPVELYKTGAFVKVIKVDSYEMVFNAAHTTYQARADNVVLIDNIQQISKVLYYSTITDSTGVYYGDKAAVLRFLDYNLSSSKLEDDGALAVNLQDQTTQSVIQKFNRIAQSTTMAADRSLEDRFITVTDTLGIENNRHIIIFNPTALRFTSFDVISIGVDTLYLDAPLDFDYTAGSFVDFTSTNMAVDGSTTTQTFGLRGVSPSPVGITVDVTRIIFTCQTTTAIDLSKFGDIVGGITNGIVLRKRDGTYYNIFNAKMNSDLAGLGYDFNPHSADNPQQGQHGFIFRLTFAGQNKIGVAIRLFPGEDLELLVQDALQTITVLEVVAEGHIVN